MAGAPERRPNLTPDTALVLDVAPQVWVIGSWRGSRIPTFRCLLGHELPRWLAPGSSSALTDGLGFQSTVTQFRSHIAWCVVSVDGACGSPLRGYSPGQPPLSSSRRSPRPREAWIRGADRPYVIPGHMAAQEQATSHRRIFLGGSQVHEPRHAPGSIPTRFPRPPAARRAENGQELGCTVAPTSRRVRPSWQTTRLRA